MAMVLRRRRYGGGGGLGNVPIPGLSSAWSLGDPASNMWGASYYNGSKVMGRVDGGPGGVPYWETQAVLYATPWDQATEDAITAAANANFASPEHAAWQYDQDAAASPEPMRSVLMDPEWKALALSGQPVVYSSLSAELQSKIQAVPLLYAQLIGDMDKFNQLAAAQPAPAPSTEPARYLQGGVETYGDPVTGAYVPNGTPVPGGYNAAADQAAQIAAQTPSTPTVAFPDQVTVHPSDAMQASNPTSSMLPQGPGPSGPGFDVSPAGSAGGARLAGVGGSTFSNPWLLAAIGLGVVVLASRKRHT